MISDAKLEANRRNAAKSTGPKTPEGKAVSKMNALRHGLLSDTVLLPDEDEDRFEAFREGMLQQLQPAGELEQLLADRVVATAWRLRRAAEIETRLLERSQHDVPQAALMARYGHHEDVGYAFLNDAQGPDCFSRLSRYESALERGFYRALHELQRLQSARAGEPVPAPVAVDVTVNGGFVSQIRPAPAELPDFLKRTRSHKLESRVRNRSRRRSGGAPPSAAGAGATQGVDASPVIRLPQRANPTCGGADTQPSPWPPPTRWRCFGFGRQGRGVRDGCRARTAPLARPRRSRAGE
jgi:hypothetical protein